MKKIILAIVQNQFFQHLLFWAVAGFVIYRLTVSNNVPTLTDFY